MSMPLRKGLGYSLSVVVGLGLLGGVLYYAGWRDVLHAIQALGWTGACGVLGSVLFAISSWVLSWWVILFAYGIRLSIGRVLAAWLSGYAVSYLTPTIYFGGEPFRALMISDRTPAPTTRVFATIIVERFLGGLGLIVFVLIGSFYAVLSPRIDADYKRVVIAGVAFITFWIMIGFLNFAGNFKWISRLLRTLRHLIPRWRKGFERAANKVSETEDEVYDAFTKHRKGILIAFLIQLCATFFVYMRPQVFFHFSTGTTFDFSQLSLLFTLNILLSFFLWLTPGGLGTSEAALIGIFALVGIAKDEAVAFALVFKVVELLFVGLGIILLVNGGIGRFIPRLRRQQDPSL